MDKNKNSSFKIKIDNATKDNTYAMIEQKIDEIKANILIIKY